MRAEGAGRGAHVAGEARTGSGTAGHGVREALAELVEARAARHRRREHRGPGHAVALHEAHEVGAALLDLRGREAVGLVEHDHRHGLVGRQGRHVVVVEPGVGVLLRVGHPHEEVDELEDPLGLGAVPDLGGVEVGQVEQDQPVEGAELGAELGTRSTVGGDVVAGADPEPVEEVAHRFVTPDRGGGGRGGRAPDADLGDGIPDERVEERGLAAAGRAGERDDRVATDEGGALGDLRDDGVGAGTLGRGKLGPTGVDGRRERGRRSRQLLR